MVRRGFGMGVRLACGGGIAVEFRRGFGGKERQESDEENNGGGN